MNTLERNILDTFKALLLKRLSLYEMILFGSRRRGDATQYSDMDVLVILDKSSGEQDYEYVNDCPERYSLLAQAAEKEDVLI